MRILAIGGLIIAATVALDAPDAIAKGPPWCAAYRNGSTNCGFYTYQQCMETIAGNGGFCNRNYIDGEPDKPAARKERKEREAEPKAKRKDKEEVKERVAPAQKPVPPPAAAQPAPVIGQPPPAPPAAAQAAPAIVQPPPAPVAVQPAPMQQLMNNFQTARALILSGKYEAGIAAMKALGYDDHPDVASSIGFANAKLGNLSEARAWYNKALAADPNHLRTWSDSGALYLVQGDLAKARGDLDRIKAICGGTACPEYQQLEGLIAAKTR
jgi:tetratricopeptide (TPR) repeat protein